MAQLFRVEITEDKVQGHRIDYTNKEQAKNWMKTLQSKGINSNLRVIWA
jgi:hypothetical protein